MGGKAPDGCPSSQLHAPQLTQKLLTVLPTIVVAALHSPDVDDDFSGAAEVLEGWHLDGWLYALAVLEALSGSGAERITVGDTSDSLDITQATSAVIAELG